MKQFDVKRGGRKCHVSGENFQPGDVFFSALLDTTAGLQRHDYSQAAWQALDDEVISDVIGWWKQQVPPAGTAQVQWAPDEVLLAWFESVAGDDSQSDVAWITGLLLIQKRLLQRVDEEQRSDDGEGPENLILLDRRTNQQYELQPCEISTVRRKEIEALLHEQLFSESVAIEE